MIKASKIFHRNQFRIRVDFPYNQSFISILRQIEDARWSQTHKAWHIPYDKQSFAKLKSLFSDIEIEYQTESNNKQKGVNQFEIESLDTDKIHQTENEINQTIQTVNQTDIINVDAASFAHVTDFSKVNTSKQSNNETHLPVNTSVSIEVIYRQILVKLPKNDTDTKFLLTFRYAKFDKVKKWWIIPNFPSNLELLKSFFKDRISSITIHETKSYNINNKNHSVSTQDVLCVLTRNQRLKLIFGFNEALVKTIKQMPYWSWSQREKWWTIPFSDKLLEEIKLISETEGLTFRFEEETYDKTKVPRKTAFDVPNYKQAPESMILKLKELRYSERTIKAYKSLFEELINYYPTIEIDKIDEAKIVAFCQYLVIERKVSISYQNQAINAIKFYYERVLGGQRKIYALQRPDKEKALPTVLNTDEIVKILQSADNLKHRAILTVIYSAGLRISELINLKIKDIDTERKQIKIEQSKGKKDRYTLLSAKTLDLLRTYFKEYHPKEYLFEGADGGPYSARSVQTFFKDICKLAGIKKKVSVHTLRHSFATHLLENGTDLRYIQSLLGHENPKTTEVYTHITNKGFEKIKSPLDGLNL